MADIARISGVSITTVSHVLNKTRPVRPQTEDVVLSAVAQVGYTPATIGSAGGTRTLGLASSAISNPSFNDLIHGIERAATRIGYSLLIADTHDDVSVELRAMAALLSRKVEAILFAPSPDPSAALGYAERQGVPVVVLDRVIDAEVDQIGSENVESTASLVDHLARNGHDRIAMVSGLPGISTTRERIEGFRLGMSRNRVPVTAGSIVSGGGQDRAAADAVIDLMSASVRPTALVVGNNRMTIGAMRGLRELGLEVPRDIALVAFDDFEWADLFHPRLTVIAQQTASIGEQAVEMTMSRLADPDRAARKVTLTPTLVHRESCGCSD